MNYPRGWSAMGTHVRRPKLGKRHGRPLALLLLGGAYHKAISRLIESVICQKKRGAPVSWSASS
jgi:hypothetical protein